jgi:large subunit ribosomal protein L17
MASSLILHKRITTTVAKAKALKKFVEPLITRAKDDSTHSRRMAFSYLQNKESVTTLFGEVADKVSARPGGYTRILKTGYRLGDNADMCIMELVDFNELMLKEAAPAKAKTRRSRRGSSTTDTKVETTEDAVVIEETAVEERVEESVETTDVAESEEDTTSEKDDSEKKDKE